MSQPDLIADFNYETRRMSTLFLGFAAAAIGFGVHEISTWSSSWALMPVGLAGASWGISFYCGIQWVHSQQESMAANFLLNKINELHPRYAEAKAKWDVAAKEMGRLYARQMYGLLAGAIFFAFGQGIRIAESSPIDMSNTKRCAAIQKDMLRAVPQRADSVALFSALGCRPQGSGSVYVRPQKGDS